MFKIQDYSWKHKLFSVYVRSKHHPAKLRLVKCLQRLFFHNANIIAALPSGALICLDPADIVQHHILHNGCYEPQTLNLVKSLLSPGSTFIDVGANVGMYTLEISCHVGDSGKIIAVEPNPKTFCNLLNNIELNDFKNILPVLGAASSDRSFISMTSLPEGNSGASREYSELLGVDFEKSYQIQTFVLVDLLKCESLNKIDLLKIDVEGAEYSVLKGLFSLSYYLPENIIFEYIPESFESAKMSADYLISMGYSLYTVDGNPYFDGLKEVTENNLWATLNAIS